MQPRPEVEQPVDPECPPQPEQRAATREVATKAVLGSLSAALGAYSSFLINFAAVTLLARMVGPTAFGEFSLAQSYTQTLFAFGAFAFGQAIIQAPTGLPAAADTGLRLILLMRAIMFAAACPIALAVAYLSTPAVSFYFLQLTVAGVLEGVRGGMSATLERELRYGRLMILNVLAALAAAAAAIGLAGAGLGAQSLVARDVLLSLVGVSGLLIMRERWGLPRARNFDRETAKHLWTFAKGLYWVRASEQVFARLDRLLLGNLAGLNDLGLYHQAKYLATLPISVIAPANQQVAIVTFSRLRGDIGRLADAFDTVQYFVSRFMTLAAVVMALFPEVVVGVVLGPRWRGATSSLQVLALYVFIAPLLETYRSLHTALEHWRLLRLSVAAQAVALISGLCLLVPGHGVRGAALALALSPLAGMAVQAPLAGRHLGGAHTGRVVSAMISGLAALVAGAVAKAMLGEGGARPALSMCIALAAFGAAILALEGRHITTRVARLQAVAFGKKEKACHDDY